MSRKPRIISPSGLYHITLRSVNQRIIFEEDADYQKFLYILFDCLSKYEVQLHSYCLMNNHVHFLLFSKPETLSVFIQSLCSRFVGWYNKKYMRSGHLFQGRFFSLPIVSLSQYLSTLCYIHNNPVRAKMCRFASEYRWSSYNAFYGQKNPLIQVARSYELAGSKDFLLEYFANYAEDKEDEFFAADHAPSEFLLTDERALEVFREVTHLTSTSAVSVLNKKSRNVYIRLLREHRLTQKQIARFMDVSISTVKRICSQTWH